jgi:hypothetical protein
VDQVQAFGFDFLDTDQTVFRPEANLRHAVSHIRDDTELNSIANRDPDQLKLQIIERDFPILINNALRLEREDVLGRTERRRDVELPKQSSFLFKSLAESQDRNLPGRAVDLTVVIAVLFELKNLPGLIDRFNVFPGTRPDDPVLEPAVRPLDLSFGLRGKRITKIDSAFLEDLFPLGIDVIRPKIMLPPDRIPALDKAENGVAVRVVGIGEAIVQNYVFQGYDMVPAGLSLDEVGIEKQSAVVIKARNQMPFFQGVGRPFMFGGIVLDQFSHIIGQDFPVMGLPFGLGEVKIVFFGPLNDCRNGDLLMVLIPETVPNIAIVIAPERNLGIFDQTFFESEFTEDVLFDLGCNFSRTAFSLVSDRKSQRILPVFLENLEEPTPSDLQNAQDVLDLDFLVDIPFEKISDLLIAEGFVKMSGHD